MKHHKQASKRATSTTTTAMKISISIVFSVLLVQYLATLSAATAPLPQYDFYYLVQQWAGSYCNTKEKCCFPKSGKPAGDAFTLHQIKPVVSKDGSSPSHCNSATYDKTKVYDVMSSMLKYWPSLSCPSEFGNQFWSSVWNTYGTCTQMDQHSYFATALKLRAESNLFGRLAAANIHPDGGFYSLKAIKAAIGYDNWVVCNTNAKGASQFYEVYLCVNKQGKFITCPVKPKGYCADKILFPKF